MYFPFQGDDDAVDVVFRVSDLNFAERIFRFYEVPFTKFLTNVVSNNLLSLFNGTHTC